MSAISFEIFSMKGKWLYVFTLFLCGIYISSFTEVKSNVLFTKAKSSITVVIASPSNSQNHPLPGGDSPFIRFHHGIGENNISIVSPGESMVPVKPVNEIPAKFAGIIECLYSLSYKLPVTRVFLYSTPLRSPPVSC